MKSLLIDEIIIADVPNKEAIRQTFNRGLNVVTSHENGVGKSSLVKSLYHSFGADVHFDKTWHLGNKLFVIAFSIDEKKYRLARKGDSYILYDTENQPHYFKGQGDGLREMYAEIFGFAIYLSNVRGAYGLAYPMCYFLPYYIDQDFGWSAKLYKSFKNDTVYTKKQKTVAIDFHLSLLTMAGVLASERKGELEELIKLYKKDAEVLSRKYKDISDEMSKLPAGFNSEEMNAQIEAEREVVESKIAEIVSCREELKSLQEDYYHCEKYRDIIMSTRGMGDRNAQKEPISYFCPSCGTLLQDILSQRLRGICFDENRTIILNQIENYLADVGVKIGAAKVRYSELGVELHEKQQKLSCLDYFKADALKGILVEMQEKIAKNKSLIAASEKELSELKVTDAKEVKEKRNRVYEQYFNAFWSLLNRLRIKAEGNFNRKIDDLVGGQGTEIPQSVLCHHMALMQTICNQPDAQIQFPFVLDSPRATETSDGGSMEILSLLAECNPSSQTILATIDYSKYVREEDVKSVNIIELSNKGRLLDEGSYMQNSEQIAKIDEAFSTYELVSSMKGANN